MEAQKRAYSGELKEGTKKRMARAIDLLIQSAKTRWQYNPVTGKEVKHRLSFITLTISQQENLTQRQAYDKCFKHWLQWLRRTAKVKTYIWKAEVQKRGQIHYHITTPSWIHYQEVRDSWNNLQRKAGFLSGYYRKTGHYDPNSTDIHEVQHIKDLSSYLKKEYCKAIQNPKTDGKIWDCSTNLKESKYYSFRLEKETGAALFELEEKKKIYPLELEQCTVWKGNIKDLLSVMGLKEIRNYDEHIQAIRQREKKPGVQAKASGRITTEVSLQEFREMVAIEERKREKRRTKKRVKRYV